MRLRPFVLLKETLIRLFTELTAFSLLKNIFLPQVYRDTRLKQRIRYNHFYCSTLL